MSRHVEVDPALWEEFHRVVNMSSRELSGLAAHAVRRRRRRGTSRSGRDEDGAGVLKVLQKRRVDLDEEDERIMRKVVDRIHAERSDEMEPTAGSEDWRHRLMTIGHDPLKPTR